MAECGFCLEQFEPKERDGVMPSIWSNYCEPCEADGRAAVAARLVRGDW